MTPDPLPSEGADAAVDDRRSFFVEACRIVTAVAGAPPPQLTRRPVLDTRESYDAHILGYDGPADPWQDGYGLVVFRDGGRLTLCGPEGQVELCSASELRSIMAECARAIASDGAK